MWAQTRTVHVCVKDQSGSAIANVQLRAKGAPTQIAITDMSGCADLTFDAGKSRTVDLQRSGFEEVIQPLTPSPTLMVVMHPAARREVIDVTAARVPLALDATASSVRSLSSEQLDEAPGLTFDDQLRQVDGFQLFRRSSGWVANPTTQGTSLRGLGSTAASRTLVLSDQVPLNDAFGGWIHWNETPELAIAGVELMRGGGSDLYGSSAIGGVIDVLPVRPDVARYELDLSGASRDSSAINGLAAQSLGHWSALAATTLFRTAGYTLIAPPFRGLVDVPSNVHSQSGRVEIRRSIWNNDGIFLRGNLLNEARSNGTPLQTNATRLWRYIAGADWILPGSARLLLRVYGTDQDYRQSFSSIAASRASENLTKLQRVPTQQIGGVVQWAAAYHSFTFVAGGDIMDTRGTDNETPIVKGTSRPTVSTSARQRQGGVYGEVLWQPQNWSIAFSSRVDQFHSFDAQQTTGAFSTALPVTDEFVFDPRLGIVRKLGRGVSIAASGFRAFRGPSMNELYRTGQVGQQITQANPSLRSERATGMEVGALSEIKHLGLVRASYFWTQVNRPVAAITLSSTPTSVLQLRENLGQLTSRGITAEVELRPTRYLTITGGYQYANSTVTKFQADPTLVGKWTAQVPRNSASAQARFEKSRIGILGVDLRTSGQQFDDSANQFQLAAYAQFDLYAEHRWRNRFTTYVSVQNVVGNLVEAGRTPVLTLGIPRTIAVGLKIR